MAATTLLVLAVVAVTVGIYWLFPDAVARTFRRAQQARQLIFGIIAVITALVLLGSGSPVLMLIGALGIAYGVIWLLVDDPLDSLTDVIG